MDWGELIRVLLSAAIGTMGFGWLFHAPRKAWLPAALLGGAAFGIYRGLAAWGLNDSAAVFLATLAGTVAALALARRLKTVGTTFLMMSIVAFVPGLGLYRTMQFFGSGDIRGGAAQGVEAMVTIIMIALGQAVGSMLFRFFQRPAAAAAQDTEQRTGR